MTYDRADQARSRAERDYHRAIQALFNADSESARKRHARRAQTAVRRLQEAKRDLRRLQWQAEDQSETLALYA